MRPSFSIKGRLSLVRAAPWTRSSRCDAASRRAFCFEAVDVPAFVAPPLSFFRRWFLVLEPHLAFSPIDEKWFVLSPYPRRKRPSRFSPLYCILSARVVFSGALYSKEAVEVECARQSSDRFYIFRRNVADPLSFPSRRFRSRPAAFRCGPVTKPGGGGPSLLLRQTRHRGHLFVVREMAANAALLFDCSSRLGPFFPVLLPLEGCGADVMQPKSRKTSLSLLASACFPLLRGAVDASNLESFFISRKRAKPPPPSPLS